MRSFASPALAAILALALGLATGCGAAGTSPSAGELTSSTSEAVTASSIASLALANVGGSACGTNSLGSHSFDSSCTGNGGQPEYWCADFARWVWEQEGAGNTSELTAAAGSFYVYGQNHGTLENTPAVGDAVVFDYKGGGVADHVALVTQVNGDGTIETASGDWNGQSGTEAQFSSTSHVVLNAPAYPGTVGSSPGVMGMTISAFIAPVGIAAADWGAGFVSQSFPLASTPLTMFAGQTLSQTLVLKNTGAKPWDASTRIGTTQPRDRASAFAAPTWVGDNRLAEASGSVAPGGSFTFTFDFHAPAKTGNYLEYFGVVEEGVAWFSDASQGGPPDDDLEANITVVSGVRGNLDAAACTGITGWTQDQATPDAASSVELTFDAPAGKTGAGAMTVSAAVDRSDLCKAIGSCSHGFSITPPPALRDGKAHQVYAYGVPGVADGDPVELAGGPLTFTCDAVAPPYSTTTGVKRHVADATSFGAWKFDSLMIAPESDAEVASYPAGAELPATPAVVLAPGSPAVWVIDGTVRRHVLDPASMTAWSFTAADWTDAQVNAYPQGPDWPETPYLVQGAGEAEVYVLDADPATEPGDGGAGTGSGGKQDGGGSSGGSGASAGTSSGGSWATPGGQGSGGGSGGGCSAAVRDPRDGRFAGGAWALVLGGVALVSRRRRAGAAAARDARASGAR